MKTFDIILVKDHILINNGEGHILIDTGNPVSFHKTGKITLGEENFKVPTSFMGVDCDYVSRNVGVPVDGMLGMDYISRHNTVIDVPGKTILFDADTEGYTEIPSLVTGDRVLIDLSINGRSAKVFLDTGAPVSYVDSSLTEGLESSGTASDFHPVIGEFTTSLFDVTAQIGDRDFCLTVGNLPFLMQLTLNACGGHGAIGMDLLRQTRVLISNGRVYIKTV